MRKYLFFIAAAALMTACSAGKNIYQVYDVMSDDVQKTSNGLVYENSDLKLTYDFCSEGGDMSFYCYNKTDKTMYISLPESFFVRNGISYDYYADCDYTSTTVRSLSKSIVNGGSVQVAGRIRSIFTPEKWYLGSATRYTGASTTVVAGRSEAVTTHAEKHIAIPAHSMKLIPSFLVYNSHYLQCGKGMYDVNYPTHHTPMISYNAENTPLVFANSISYTFDMDDKSSYKNITNTFYISSLQNFNEKEVLIKNPDYKRVSPRSKKADACSSEAKYYFQINDASKFYNKYPRIK